MGEYQIVVGSDVPHRIHVIRSVYSDSSIYNVQTIRAYSMKAIKKRFSIMWDIGLKGL